MTRNGHKFNAVKTVIDNITFASKAEAKRYGELKMLEKAGKIHGLQLQPRYELIVANPLNGTSAVVDPDIVIGRYVADFCYMHKSPTGTTVVVEDTKGFKTDLYKWKKKHFEAQYGITITEITR